MLALFEKFTVLRALRWQAVMVIALLSQAGLAVAAAGGEGAFEEFAAHGAYAKWNERELVVGNPEMEGQWRLVGGRLVPQSWVLKKSGIQLLRPASARPAAAAGSLQVTAKAHAISAVAAPGLALQIKVVAEQSATYTLRTFGSGSALMLTQAGSPPAGPVAAATKAQSDGATEVEKPKTATALPNRNETLASYLSGDHVKITGVQLVDQTDAHNELVSEREWLLWGAEAPITVSGNLLVAENVLDGSGIVWIKLAPLPHARETNPAFDFRIDAATRSVEVGEDHHPVAMVAYAGGTLGRTKALQQYQRLLRVPDWQRDGLFMTNTWGDRSQDARLTETFVRQELAAAQKLGAHGVFLDDGWQRGRTANSARATTFPKLNSLGGMWNYPVPFWEVDPVQFPGGLAPLADEARQRGLKLGLWFGGDSAKDFANWERDAAQLLQLRRSLGVNDFKIDFTNTPTRAAQDNLQNLFRRVLAESGGAVTIDFDVTARKRLGYFNEIVQGPVFLENRYTDWAGYWPHLTLRNLWALSKYIDPLRLRIEFLNNARNQERYRNTPLVPARYRPDTLFAITMMSSPLGWFEASGLSSAYIEQVSPLVKLWKAERERMLGGAIIPIGSAPDGVSWTGFASVAPNDDGAYLLVFRELNQDKRFQVDLKPLGLHGPFALTPLHGRGRASLTPGGQVEFVVEQPLDHLWVRLSRKKR